MADTTVVIATSGQEFQLPGTDWTVASIKSTFSTNVPGIASMEAREETTEVGKTITFSPRAGTKG